MKYADIFRPSDILLPKKSIKPETWAVIACDQFTSSEEYWQETKQTVGDNPSALSLILPEVYLSQKETLIPRIDEKMEEAIRKNLVTYPDSYVYVERTQPDGRVRHGIIGALDLEAYSFDAKSALPVRATEKTVPERIPPRVAIRENAPLELTHILLLCNEPKNELYQAIARQKQTLELLYDFDLMQGGGHLMGYRIPSDSPLANLLSRYPEQTSEVLIAVGDGNHSLATARTCYENLKQCIGLEKAKTHPARYALCEMVNIYDDALDFEPIYRVVNCKNPDDFIAYFENKIKNQSNLFHTSKRISVKTKEECRDYLVPMKDSDLPVSFVQPALDEYLASHPDASVDYIHGLDEIERLVGQGSVGIVFDGMSKGDLFSAVSAGGSLPRKTFSMGHARDKRYYMECRKIK